MPDASTPSASHERRLDTVLITGANGFVGQWLSRALLERGARVVGTATHADASLDARVEWQVGDMRDDAFLERTARSAIYDAVVHLAAISHLPTAAADPGSAWEVNVTATARLLHHLQRARDAGTMDPTVLVVGSGEQYGRHDNDGAPLEENVALAPRTVYAATKCAQEILALQLWRASGLRIATVRSFNHSGPGQEQRFLLPALVARASALRHASAPATLLLGNMTPVRDFLHVADVVDAYIMICSHASGGETFNVASGVGRSVRDVALAILHASGVEATLAEDPALVRAVDVPSLVGDSARLQSATGWRIRRTFDDLLTDLIADHQRHATTH